MVRKAFQHTDIKGAFFSEIIPEGLLGNEFMVGYQELGNFNRTFKNVLDTSKSQELELLFLEKSEAIDIL